MSSFFLFSASITLVLLSILPFSTADLVDTDGDPILNGREYYIIPVSGKSGLTYTPIGKNCPLYIIKEKTKNSPGTPVTISSPAKTLYISLDEGVSLTLRGPTVCNKSLKWGTTYNHITRKFYITAGSEANPRGYPFSIAKSDKSETSTYELKYGTGDGPSLGFYEDEELLGIGENPTIVSFKKAFNVLELSTALKK